MPQRSSDELRLFVGLYPGLNFTRPAQAWTEELAQGGRMGGAPEVCGLVPEPHDRLHATLLFLGKVRRGHLERTLESADSAAAGVGPFEVKFDSLAVHPSTGKPRVLALEASQPPRAMLDLQSRLAARLGPSGAKRRAFWPHVTLGRFHPPSALDREGLALARGPELPAVRFEKLVVVESRLEATGSRHLHLSSFNLRGR